MNKKLKSQNKTDPYVNSPYKPRGFPKSIRRKPPKLLSDRSGPYSLV